MDLDAPFTGELSVPDKLLPHGESPVELPDGQLVAQIRQHLMRWRSFDILDAQGQQVATGTSSGWMRRRYTVTRTNGEQLLQLTLGWRGTSGTSKVSLHNGAEMTVRGSTFRRSFAIRDTNGAEVGTIRPVFRIMGFGGNDYRARLHQPVLSLLQVVSLTKCLRKAVKSSQSHRNRRGPVGTRHVANRALGNSPLGTIGGRGSGLGNIGGRGSGSGSNILGTMAGNLLKGGSRGGGSGGPRIRLPRR
jgi:hypothetical protein